MPGQFNVPQPSVAPTVSQSRSRFYGTYMRRGGEMAEAQGLAQLGGVLYGIGAERAEKEDAYQLTRAKADYMAASEKFQYDYLSSDLSSPDNQGYTGFHRGSKEYRDFLREQGKTMSRGVSRNVRGKFRDFRTAFDAQQSLEFSLRLSDRQREFQQQDAKKRILTAANVGDRRHTEFILNDVAHQRIYDETQFRELYDLAMEQTIVSMMEMDPDKAIEAAQGYEWHNAGVERRLVKAAKDTKEQFRIMGEEDEIKQRLATGRSVYADIMAYRRTNGQAGRLYTIGELNQLYTNGDIKKEMYDGASLALTQEEKPDALTAMRSYAKMDDAIKAYRDGLISADQLDSVYWKSLPEMEEKDWQPVYDEMSKVRDEVRDTLVDEAKRDARFRFIEVLTGGSLFGTPDELKLREARGLFAHRINELANTFIRPNKPVDRLLFMREATGLIREISEALEQAPVELPVKSPLDEVPDDLWSSLTEDQRKKVRGLSKNEQQKFVRIETDRRAAHRRYRNEIFPGLNEDILQAAPP